MEIRRAFVTGGTGYLGDALDADSFADQVAPAVPGGLHQQVNSALTGQPLPPPTENLVDRDLRHGVVAGTRLLVDAERSLGPLGGCGHRRIEGLDVLAPADRPQE